MSKPSVRYLLDIEGTICPISFVKEELYPYALKALKEILHQNGLPLPSNHPMQPYLDQFPQQYLTSDKTLIDHVQELTHKDIKAPYWKALQGYLWKSGYESGAITVPMFPDAVDFIKRNAPVSIYSSGSIAAQKLLFAHVKGNGDLNHLISHYFDTTTAGSKLESTSYEKISQQLGNSKNIIFISDNVKELAAAREANLEVLLAIRPNNAPVSQEDLSRYKSIQTFQHL